MLSINKPRVRTQGRTRPAARGNRRQKANTPTESPCDVQQANSIRINTNRDPVSRECLEILVQGMQALADQIAEISGRIEGILK